MSFLIAGDVHFIKKMIDIKGVAREGAGRSVNPIQTRGVDYAPHTTAHYGFKKLTTPLKTILLFSILGNS